MKKHVSQMIKYEKRIIGRAIRRRSSWELTPYCTSRLTERNMTVEAINEVIKNGDLIEFHRKDGANRVLLRGRKSTECKDTACVVVDLDSGEVVTAYWNTHDDHHLTLDWSAYDDSINIAEYLRGRVIV